MQSESERNDHNKQRIKSPEQFYPGICNLCDQMQHKTPDCPNSVILYHATNLQSLKLIVQNGFIHREGRLGKAIYCSDQPSMCIRFVLKNPGKFTNPVLLKIKAYITNTILTVKSSEQVKHISQETFKRQKIECIKCPYFKVKEQIQYQYALYDVPFFIVGWSRIKMPGSNINKQVVQKKQQNTAKVSIENIKENKDQKIQEKQKKQIKNPSIQQSDQQKTMQIKSQILSPIIRVEEKMDVQIENTNSKQKCEQVDNNFVNECKKNLNNKTKTIAKVKKSKQLTHTRAQLLKN